MILGHHRLGIPRDGPKWLPRLDSSFARLPKERSISGVREGRRCAPSIGRSSLTAWERGSGGVLAENSERCGHETEWCMVPFAPFTWNAQRAVLEEGQEHLAHRGSGFLMSPTVSLGS